MSAREGEPRPTLADEARMYWAASFNFHRIRDDDAVPDDDVGKALDETEVISLYTDWQPLKSRCAALPNGEKWESAAV